MAEKKYIVELLEKRGLITKPQGEEAFRAQARSGERVENILVRLGYITQENLLRALSLEFGMESVTLAGRQIPSDVIDLIPSHLARRHRIIPLKKNKTKLTIALSDPLDLPVLDSLQLLLKCGINTVLASEEEISRALENYYGLAGKETVDTIVQDLAAEGEIIASEEEEEDASDDDAPIIKLAQLIILEAFRSRASDIHIEPLEEKLRVRYRIDGVLHEVPAPPRRLQGAIISRVKLMAGMDIAEKRMPQDGRIRIKVGDKELDLRVSTLPATHGESLVLRILEKTSLLAGMTELGFMPEDQERFERLIERPNGIILDTGPTGSGKTTTLYASLTALNRPNRKLITVEEPVEYQIAGINQVQVNAQIGLTFSGVLRSMLRQAPDVIMVGEIRDYETAAIAIQAALTGHLVFSTLHTNDAPGAVTRLIDMGVKPYLVASALEAVLAQRLVRTICSHCKTSYQPTKEELAAVGLTGEALKEDTFCRGKGCPECSNTGYRGRKAIFEMLIITDAIRDLIFERASSASIRERAKQLGMKTLREDGVRKVLAGITTLEEVMRVTQGDVG